MIINYQDKKPNIHNTCFIANNATIIGQVTIEAQASVFFQCVIRGDKDQIHIKEMSNIQDNCTLHTDPDHILSIGKRVSVGHNAILHGAIIEDDCLIGMGAIILNGAHIGKHCIIGAGALVKEHQIIPDYSVVVGNPGRVIKTITQEQMDHIYENAQHYADLAQEYKEIQTQT